MSEPGSGTPPSADRFPTMYEMGVDPVFWVKQAQAWQNRCSAVGFVCLPPYNGEMAKILVVDDSPDVIETLCKQLSAAGHDVRCVPNGKEALMEVLSNLPDVVLLDLAMPEMDGPSFLEVVRSYLRLQSLPVVVFTAMGDSPMIERVQRLKVNDVLIKGKATGEDILKSLQGALIRAPS